MHTPWFLLASAILLALIFDLVNGFHDSANSIATIVSTRVLRPRTAVLWAAFFNFIAMFIFLPRVAETMSQIVKIAPNETPFIYVVIAGLAGAIIWDMITWWLGLPTSSSHALIGSLVGAGVTYAGWNVICWNKVLDTALFIFIAPLIGLLLGFFLKYILNWIFHRSRPLKIDRFFRKGQLFSAALYSIGHGANDAQKTMGILLALMIASGHLPANEKLSIYNPHTLWMILSCNLAMALGTTLGGWRIVKTMGTKITKLQPIGGFCAESAGAFTLFFATLLGVPVSTTQTINGAIMGVGCCSPTFSGVRWKVARQIFLAWILTIPASALLASLIFLLFSFIF